MYINSLYTNTKHTSALQISMYYHNCSSLELCTHTFHVKHNPKELQNTTCTTLTRFQARTFLCSSQQQCGSILQVTTYISWEGKREMAIFYGPIYWELKTERWKTATASPLSQNLLERKQNHNTKHLERVFRAYSCFSFMSLVQCCTQFRLCTRVVQKGMSNFFLHANWEQQTKDSAVVDGTSCCVILQCLVRSIACIT